MPDVPRGKAAIAVGAALLAYPFLVKDPFWQHLAILTLLLASLASAWNIIGGMAGQISFGHSIFFAIGAYATAYPIIHAGVVPWVGMVIGSALAVVAAIIIGVPVFRLRGHHFSIATIAMQQVLLVFVINSAALGRATGLEVPIESSSLWNLQFSVRDQVGYHLVVLGLFALCTLAAWRFASGRAGAYARALRDDEQAARASGVPAHRYKLYALVLSASLTALCGGFYAMYSLFVDPNVVLSLTQSIAIALAAVLGGAGRLWGPLIGAVALVGIQETTRVQLSGIGGGFDLVIYGLIIMLIAIAEPGGIIGLAERIIGATRSGGRNPLNRSTTVES
jgi:branched-chain amino acid transport system permease protein